MTNPAEYITGRTVQEQMNQLIGYVDTRAAEVATTAIASDVADVAQAKTDAESARDAAIAAKDTAVSTVSDCVKMNPAAPQTITGQKLTTSGGLETTTLDVTGAETHSGAEDHSGTVEVSGTFYTDNAGSNNANNVRRIPCALSVRDSFDASATDGSTVYYPIVGLDDGNGDGAVRIVMRKNDTSYDIFFQGLGLDESQALVAVGSFNRNTKVWTTTAVTPGSGAGSTETATVGYVSNTGGSLNNLLHTSADETFTGTKTGTVANYGTAFKTKITSIDVTSPPSVETLSNITFCDKNNVGFANLRAGYSAAGLVTVGIQIRNNDGTFKYITLGTADN